MWGARPSTELFRGEGKSLPPTTKRKPLLLFAGSIDGTFLHRPKTIGNQLTQAGHVTKLFRHLTRQRAPPVNAVLQRERIFQAPADGILAGGWQPPCGARFVTMGTGIQVHCGHAFVTASSQISIDDSRSAGQVHDWWNVHILCRQWRSEGS